MHCVPLELTSTPQKNKTSIHSNLRVRKVFLCAIFAQGEVSTEEPVVNIAHIFQYIKPSNRQKTQSFNGSDTSYKCKTY